MSLRGISGRVLPLALLVVGVSLGSDAGNSRVQGPDRAPAVSRAELRQRFDSLTPDQKQALRDRLEELKQLPAQQRQQLRAQADRFEAMGRRVYQSMPARDRERLDGLPARKRQELLHEMALAEVQDMSHRILRKLPKQERERIEAANPSERRQLLADLRGQMDRRIAESIKTMAPELGFSPKELGQLNDLPPDERRTKFLLVVKRRCSGYVQREGLPKGVASDQWERIRSLPPDEFYLALLNLRREFPDLARVARANPIGTERSASSTQDRGLRRVRRALETHLDASERLGLAGSNRAERQHELRRRRRQRAMTALGRSGFLTEELTERLRSIPDDAFFSQVRRFLDSGGEDSALRPVPATRRRPSAEPGGKL